MKPSTVLPVLCLLAGLAPCALWSQSTLDLGIQGSVSGQRFTPWASLSYSGSASSFTAGASTFLDFDLEGAKSLSDNSWSGTLDLSLALSRLSGASTFGLRLDATGALPSATDAGVAAFALSLPVVLNGSAASLSLSPHASVDILESGYAGCGLDAEASFMVGEVVVKPGLGFALLWPWTGGLEYSIKPLASLAWYPGFPLTISAGGELLFHGGAGADSSYLSWGFDFLSVAAPERWLLLTLTASGDFSPTSTLIHAGLEAALGLSRGEAGKEWSLSLKAAIEHDGTDASWLVGIGLRCAF